MTRHHLTTGSSLIAALLLATIAHAGTPAAAPADQSDIASLHQRVSDLTKRNLALEAQVARLEQQLQQLQWQTTQVTHEHYSSAPPVPPGAVPHLFNGGIYYTIPVNAQP
jgi:septal ring factor EnvC (AmiA/AmiB activator)